MKVKKLLSTNSEIVEVRYRLSFGLDVEPKQGKIVCTKMVKGKLEPVLLEDCTKFGI